MAETVQFHLESRLPELQDLLEKKIFTKHEIKEIVSKRTKFEYKIKSRLVEVDDYYQYIEFEKQLERERKERVERLKITSKHSISNYGIVQHIYSIYSRAVIKFK